jgi:hypothetical protein
VTLASYTPRKSPRVGGVRQSDEFRQSWRAQASSLFLAQANAAPAAAPAAAAQAQAEPANVPQQAGSMGWDDPSQAIFVIRRLKQEPPAAPNK